MILEIMDLKDGVIKVTLNHKSFLIDTGKAIDEILSLDDICPDGTLVVECLCKGNKATRWINLAPYFRMLHQEELIEDFSLVSDLLLVS